jgi:hypothetical protein
MSVANWMHKQKKDRERQALKAQQAAQAAASKAASKIAKSGGEPATLEDLQELLNNRPLPVVAYTAPEPIAVVKPAAPPPPPALNTLTTREKVARGLSESQPARGTVVNSANSDALAAREKRFELSNQGMSRASTNITAGLKLSQPSHGPTKPAA